MGCRWSEVRILSPRPMNSTRQASFFSWPFSFAGRPVPYESGPAKRYAEFVAAHPELPLAFAYQMRNAVAHSDFKVGYSDSRNQDFAPARATAVLSTAAFCVTRPEARSSFRAPDCALGGGADR